MTHPHIGILGTGSYVPEEVLTNSKLEQSLGLTDQWIFRKTGVRERRVVAAHESTSDLATRAALRALTTAGVEAADLDLIVVATSTPDRVLPATACAVQANIGATRAAAFDVEAVCAGFVYGLAIVEAAMRGQPGFRTALVIGADTYSRILDYQDRRTCILFGDGAGAAVIAHVHEGYGVLASHLRSDGSRADLVQIPAGGSRKPLSEESLANREQFFKMDGRAVRDFVTERFPETVYPVLEQANLTLEDVDLVIPHQSNGVMLRDCMQSLRIDPDRVHYTLERYGNTAAASVPITLDDAIRSGRVRAGDVVLLTAFGGGMTWGSNLIRWQP